MKREEIYAIAEQFSEHDVRFSDERDGFDIINPFGKDPIYVEYEGEQLREPYTVCFSAHHVHLETADQVIEFVGDIIEGRRLSLELFKDGRLCMGADLDAQALRDLSYTMLAKRLGLDGTPKPYGNMGRLIDHADSFKVRGWAPNADFDGKFIVDEQGNAAVQITDASAQ